MLNRNGLDGTLALDEPVTELGGDGAFGKLEAYLPDQLLHSVFQQQAAKVAVKEPGEKWQ